MAGEWQKVQFEMTTNPSPKKWSAWRRNWPNKWLPGAAWTSPSAAICSGSASGMRMRQSKRDAEGANGTKGSRHGK